MRYEIGTNLNLIKINCLECAIREYENTQGKKYLKDTYKNKIIQNTYSWKNN